MRALLVERHPLLRIAMSELVGGIAGIDGLVVVDPAEMPSHPRPAQPVDLIVFGMPGDVALGWRWLAAIRALWPAPPLVLLSSGARLELPDGGLVSGLRG